jgi:hypothetical protein
MIRPSPRHALIMTLLLLAPAAASVYHLTSAPRAEACANPAALMQEDFLPDVHDAYADTGRHGDYVDMSNGRLAIFGPSKRPPEWRVIRTYDSFEYYFVPRRTYGDVYGDDLTGTRMLEVDGARLPVHTRIHVDHNKKHEQFSAYYYVLGGSPVRHPFTGSLGRAITQLTGGPDSLTVFMVGGRWPQKHSQERRRLVMQWLESTWGRYEAACTP